jgi:hypothetical protein
MFKLLQSNENSDSSPLLDGVRNERQQCEVPPALDGDHQHALVLRTGSRNALGDDAALLRNEPLELLIGLIVDEIFLIITEATCALFPDLAGRASL